MPPPLFGAFSFCLAVGLPQHCGTGGKENRRRCLFQQLHGGGEVAVVGIEQGKTSSARLNKAEKQGQTENTPALRENERAVDRAGSTFFRCLEKSGNIRVIVDFRFLCCGVTFRVRQGGIRPGCQQKTDTFYMPLPSRRY